MLGVAQLTTGRPLIKNLVCALLFSCYACMHAYFPSLICMYGYTQTWTLRRVYITITCMQAYSYIHSSRAEKKKMLDKIILLFALFAAVNAVYVSFCAGLCIGKEKGIRTQGHMYRADKNEFIRALHAWIHVLSFQR